MSPDLLEIQIPFYFNSVSYHKQASPKPLHFQFLGIIADNFEFILILGECQLLEYKSRCSWVQGLRLTSFNVQRFNGGEV